MPDALRDYDADGDGRLQRSEAPIALLPAFEAIDQDGDQAIDDYEAWAAERSRRAEEVRAAGRGVARGQATIRQLVQRRDLDGDGLGIDEMPESLRQHFDDLDLNGDGRIDLDEADILAARRRRVEEVRGGRVSFATTRRATTTCSGV